MLNQIAEQCPRQRMIGAELRTAVRVLQRDRAVDAAAGEDGVYFRRQIAGEGVDAPDRRHDEYVIADADSAVFADECRKSFIALDRLDRTFFRSVDILQYSG